MALPSLKMRRSQADRSTETRLLLIRAATTLLHKVGYAAVTTALIAKQAGMTTGALHHHFPTKLELMFSVLDHLAECVLDDLGKQKHLTAKSRLNVPAIVQYFWGVYKDPEYWSIWEIIIGTRSEPNFHPRVVSHRVETVQAVLHQWLERFVDLKNEKAAIFELFEFMLIVIRGLSLERFLDKNDAYFERHLKLLTSLVGQRLSALSEGRPENRRTGRGRDSS